MGSSASTPAVRPPFKQISDSLFELYAPPAGERPTVEIVFFHGFYSGPSEDVFWKTWTCQNDCWPETFLKERLPRARVLLVSYDASVTQFDTCGHLDLSRIGENLVHDLVVQREVCSPDEPDVGSYPVYLVAHSFGGLVAKQTILHAYNKVQEPDVDPRLKTFLDNLGGIFYFSTPHTGASISIFTSLLSQDSPFRDNISVLDSECVRLNNEFKTVREHYEIKAHAVVEKDKTRVGTRYEEVVTEASAMAADVDGFYISPGDHFTVCAPPSPQHDSGTQMLLRLIKLVIFEHLHRQKRPFLRWRKLVKSGKCKEVVEDIQALDHILDLEQRPPFDIQFLTKVRACAYSKLGMYDEVLLHINKLYFLKLSNPAELMDMLRCRSLARTTMADLKRAGEDLEGALADSTRAREDLEEALATVKRIRLQAELKEGNLAFCQKHKEKRDNKIQQVWCFRHQGLLKRMMGDLDGALADLNKGWELGRKSGIIDYDYQLLKERGYVKFLMADREGAQADQEEALRNQPPDFDASSYIHSEGKYIAFPKLCGEIWFGAQCVEYLGFKLG